MSQNDLDGDDDDLKNEVVPGEDLDHIPGWEGDVEEEANLAREIFFFCHLPEHDGDDDDNDDDDNNEEDVDDDEDDGDDDDNDDDDNNEEDIDDDGNLIVLAASMR